MDLEIRKLSKKGREQMTVINVKEFCKKTGFPLAMVRAYCREGKVSHWQRGRVYLLNEEDAIRELNNLKETKISGRRTVNKKSNNNRRSFVSGTFDYRAEIANLQKQCKSNARLDDKKEGA